MSAELTRERLEYVCENGIKEGHYATRIGAVHHILATDRSLRGTLTILLQENCKLQNEVTSLSDRLTHCQTVNTEMVQKLRDKDLAIERLNHLNRNLISR